MLQLSVKVAKKRVEAIDVVSLELASVDGQALPAFTAGAHIDVFVPGGLIRQYSLLNDCTESSRYLIGVLREQNSRGGSVALHDRTQEGDLIQISAPRNRFALMPARRSILFAGGIGVTPILCMAKRLQAAQSDFEFHYCSRTLDRTAFHDEIVSSDFAGRTQFHFDDQASTRMDLDAILSTPHEQTHLYVCGPAGFIDCVVAHAQAVGWPVSQIHFERFAAAEHIEPLASDQTFQVKLASTGEIFDIPPGEPITRVLDRHGVFIPVSCEEGICGTCLTGVVEGVPDHRDSYLTDQEHAVNDQFTPCCSRSKTSLLVIDA
ncbi:PDR/VanB family oxidoreductase [Alcaligenaceae bacterium CGII-47]|nr:PDR/VanB family oxidoreductase [Alcaligenaceae bacterium CGII-47]